jgi:putative transposase
MVWRRRRQWRGMAQSSRMSSFIRRIGCYGEVATPGTKLHARPGEVDPGCAYTAEFVICDQSIDITYVPTQQDGFLFLAVILDVFSRRVVGWSMADHLRAELVVAALNMAVWNRHPAPGLIHHSDHGCQYTAEAFADRCRALQIQCSMGTVGDCYDNALAESFFATLECELLDQWTFRTHDEARSAVFDFIESFYNRQRRHSALQYLSPQEYERRSIPTTPSVA